MKNPFKFAKELLRYSRGELSGREKEEVGNVLKETERLDELVRELGDKERIGEELKVIRTFDTEKALREINRKRGKGRRLFIPWVAAASVVVVAGMTVLFLLNRGKSGTRESKGYF